MQMNSDQKERQLSPEMINALNVPEDLKAWLHGMLAIRPHCEQQRAGKVWLRLVQTILLEVYKDHRPEWIKLFSSSTKTLKMKPGKAKSFDEDFTHLLKRKTDVPFVAEKCEGCTTEQMEEWRRTGKVPQLVTK